MYLLKRCITFFNALPDHEKKITIPTGFTILRILLTPLIVIAMRQHNWLLAFCVFIIASFTDLLDGILARWYNENTFLGALLDPIADKILIVSCFFTLATEKSPLFVIPGWFVSIMFFKELILTLGASVILYQKGYIALKPTKLGKYAMVGQVLFIIWVFLCYFLQLYPLKTYCLVMYMLIALTIAALLDYTLIGIKFFLNIK